jgi:hypothetical protein
VFVTRLYSHFILTDQHRGLSLSTTLVSRSMLRLRSDDTQHHRDLRVTEQTADVYFVPTLLSELSGELPSTPTAVMEYGNEEDSELKRDRERCYEGVACKRGNY